MLFVGMCLKVLIYFKRFVSTAQSIARKGKIKRERGSPYVAIMRSVT